MVGLIVGEKGKGKTKQLLDRVNAEVKNIDGNIVYLDKSAKHMFELNNKVRLINVKEYMLDDAESFLGFVCGIISQDHDLQQVYLDSFLTIANLENGGDYSAVIQKLDSISQKFGVDFIISISVSEKELSEEDRQKVIASL